MVGPALQSAILPALVGLALLAARGGAGPLAPNADEHTVVIDPDEPQPRIPAEATELPTAQVEELLRSSYTGLVDYRRQVVRSRETWGSARSEQAAIVIR